LVCEGALRNLENNSIRYFSTELNNKAKLQAKEIGEENNDRGPQKIGEREE
jgi:hypothetical protein